MEFNYNFEEWRYIPEYFGLYQVSNFGRVKSLGNGKYRREKILKPLKTKTGYLRVHLCKDGVTKMFSVHRLVAITFLPNPDNLPQVNHKNEDKTDNRVSNLEFCDAKYNTNYGTGIKRRAKKCSTTMKGVLINHPSFSKPVNQYNKEGILVAQYPSLTEAERQNGYSHGRISQCCNGKCKFAYGFVWKYA